MKPLLSDHVLIGESLPPMVTQRPPAKAPADAERISPAELPSTDPAPEILDVPDLTGTITHPATPPREAAPIASPTNEIPPPAPCRAQLGSPSPEPS